MTIKVEYNKLLSKLTFYGVGGPADEVFEVDDVSELAEIWTETTANKIPKVVIGKGSNFLPADIGFRGRVFVPRFEAVVWKGKEVVSVEAGKNFQDFIEETNQKGWGDLCNLSGIPGNVGGFLRGNAGALGTEISDSCVGVEYLDEYGNLQKIPAGKCGFGYRESIFKQKPDWCIVRGVFEFKNEETRRGASLQKTKEVLAQRWQKNPAGRSGGCLFKNPEGEIAGKLLDECGAKGDQIGSAKISEDHANFFLNLGDATQADILALARKWRGIVLEKKGIKLEPEIFICDERGQRIDL